jgi:hypothetical protein
MRSLLTWRLKRALIWTLGSAVWSHIEGLGDALGSEIDGSESTRRAALAEQ